MFWLGFGLVGLNVVCFIFLYMLILNYVKFFFGGDGGDYLRGIGGLNILIDFCVVVIVLKCKCNIREKNINKVKDVIEL